VAMAFLFSVFIQKETTATTFGYLYILGISSFGVFTIQNLLNEVSDAGLEAVSVVPSFALIRGIAALLEEVANNGPGLSSSELSSAPAYLTHVYAFLAATSSSFYLERPSIGNHSGQDDSQTNISTNDIVQNSVQLWLTLPGQRTLRP